MASDILSRLAHAATLTASDVDDATAAVGCHLLPAAAAALKEVGVQVLYADVLRALACGRAGTREGDDATLPAATASLGARVAASAARLHQLVAHVAVHHAPESAPAASLAAALSATMAEYRGGLLHLLRVAAYHALCLDAARKFRALVSPLGTTVEAPLPSVARGPPDPHEFQREHASAITTRLATVVARPRNLHRQHRLYYRYQQRATIVESTVDVTRGTSTKAVRVEAAPDIDPHRMTTVDVFVAHRGDATADACAEAGVPFAIEVVRVPHQVKLDTALAASSTLNARDAARAATNSQPSASSGVARLVPALAVPAPSAVSGQPRAHGTSAWQLGLDYTAHSDLVLSPYFPDACGVHDGADGAGVGDGVTDGASSTATAIVGPTTLYMYEYVPHAVPLSQLLSTCGPLPAGSPLMRHIAVELLAAVRDIETQCTVDVSSNAAAFGTGNVYLSEQGTRLTLRGVQWSAPLPTGPPSALQDALSRRSRALLSSYHAVLSACIAPPAASTPTGAPVSPLITSRIARLLQGAQTLGSDAPPPPSDPKPAPATRTRVVTLAHAEAGVSVGAGDALEVLLPLEASPGGGSVALSALRSRSGGQAGAAGVVSTAASSSASSDGGVGRLSPTRLPPRLGDAGTGEGEVTVGAPVHRWLVTVKAAAGRASITTPGTSGVDVAAHAGLVCVSQVHDAVPARTLAAAVTAMVRSRLRVGGEWLLPLAHADNSPGNAHTCLHHISTPHPQFAGILCDGWHRWDADCGGRRHQHCDHAAACRWVGGILVPPPRCAPS